MSFIWFLVCLLACVIVRAYIRAFIAEARERYAIQRRRVSAYVKWHEDHRHILVDLFSLLEENWRSIWNHAQQEPPRNLFLERARVLVAKRDHLHERLKALVATDQAPIIALSRVNSVLDKLDGVAAELSELTRAARRDICETFGKRA